MVTYHESCHLAHGQKITAQPRQLLSAHSATCKLVELPESTGAAAAPASTTSSSRRWPTTPGTEARHIQSTGATIVANGNPGCLLQLVNGAKRRGMPLRVVHPVTLLAEAYRHGQAPK